MSIERLFEFHTRRDTAIVVPTRSLNELDFAQLEQEGQAIIQMVDERSLQNAIVDFERTDYCGSSALSFLVNLGNLVQSRAGQMVLCNVSAHQLRILQATGLDQRWPLCDSQVEAFQAIGQDDPQD